VDGEPTSKDLVQDGVWPLQRLNDRLLMKAEVQEAGASDPGRPAASFMPASMVRRGFRLASTRD
jgi:hypothetical protein